MTPKDILLYLQTNVLLGHHQKHFLLQIQETKKKKTHSQTLCKERDFCIHSLMGQDSTIQKGWRTPRKQDFLNQQDWCSYELTEIEAACPGPAQVYTRELGSESWKEKWTHVPSPTQKLSPMDSPLQMKNWFSSKQSHWRNQPLFSVLSFLCHWLDISTTWFLFWKGSY